MPFSVRPASSHPGVGLLLQLPRCLANKHPCGTTTKVSRLFNCASQRGQSSSSAARIVSKALRPARWQLPRDELRCPVSKGTIRHLATVAAQSADASDAAAVPIESGNGTETSQSRAKRTLVRKYQRGVSIVRKQVVPESPADPRRRQLERVIQYTFKDDDYFQASTLKEIKLGGDVLPRVQLQLAIIGDCLIKMICYAEQFPLPDPSKNAQQPPSRRKPTNTLRQSRGIDVGI